MKTKIKFLRSALWILNKKFDQIRDPKRFFIFLALMQVGIICISMESIPVIAFGGAWIMLLALGRIGYIEGWIRETKL